MWNKQEPTECANCGRLIGCTQNSNCSCASIEMPEIVQDYIAATFDGCLCKHCIKKIKNNF